ncbi:hypothetical protein MCEGE14_00618 [Burkholderiaceae bacterium]
MPKINTITREQWLQQAVSALKPIFSAKGYPVPNCHVSCGFLDDSAFEFPLGCRELIACDGSVGVKSAQLDLVTGWLRQASNAKTNL